MSTTEHREAAHSEPGLFATSVLAGAVLVLLTSLVPVMAFAVIGSLVVVVWVRFARRRDAGPALAGAVLGAGLLLGGLSIVTVNSCIQTDNFCGDANVTPLATLAILTTSTGVAATARRLVLWRRRAASAPGQR